MAFLVNIKVGLSSTAVFITPIRINLVIAEAGVTHEILFNKLASEHQFNYGYYAKCSSA